MSDSDILSIQLFIGGIAISFFGIAVSAAGWNHRYFVRAMFAITALAVVVGISWRSISKPLSPDSMKAIAAVASSPITWLVMFSAGIVAILIITKLHRSATPKAIKTSLRLQFQPNSINVTCLHLENVWCWYAHRFSTAVIEPPSAQYSQGRQIVVYQWSIFLVFDKPVALKQVLVNGNGANLPTTEVADRDPRHAVIVVSGDIGAAIVDIDVAI